MRISIQEQDFDVNAELAALQSSAELGALVSFVGLVREFSGESCGDSLYLEHYPAMSCAALEAIVSAALQRWSLLDVRVIHRVGHLPAREKIVLVATAAGHRGDAFAACEYIIDRLKTDAPFWKKECSARGGEWLTTKDSDVQRAARWEVKS
jgi:molybdopterin synthase catalytic subunit